jgi:hypothetical protein
LSDSTFTWSDKALNPKSEILRFPETSSNRFSSCIREISTCKFHTVFLIITDDTNKEQNQGWTFAPSSLCGIRPYCGNSLQHWSTAESMYVLPPPSIFHLWPDCEFGQWITKLSCREKKQRAIYIKHGNVKCLCMQSLGYKSS